MTKKIVSAALFGASIESFWVATEFKLGHGDIITPTGEFIWGTLLIIVSIYLWNKK